MSSGRKCKNCGGSDIEVDPARGDAVCTTCGSVLEDTIIVAEVEFEEGARGTASAIGQFVSADSKGGATKFGASFHIGGSVESRELTLKKARQGITKLCTQLRLNQHCIETACTFFNMALMGNLTRGRRNTHVYAACVYLTCRTEGTAHLLIDISDVLQICCYELGRTYLKLSQALCISIPSIDPCLYILRFAGKLQFGAKTQTVANTALRLVQRMKRDSIHSGRRPSGLCGAALLISARLHDFCRSPSDIVKIVKVHKNTLRKRLIEFGDTPSSALTLEEFMTVDLEEEQDPPSFKAARKKDKERLMKITEEEVESFSELQKQIEMQLDYDRQRRTAPIPMNKQGTKKGFNSGVEELEEERFIEESTMGTIEKFIQEPDIHDPQPEEAKGLGPDIASMGLAVSLEDSSNAMKQPRALEVNLVDFSDIDDAEIDTYIMTENEFECKKGLWYKKNAAYLEQQKLKAEQLQKEREEGKPEKKKKRAVRKKIIGPANSAGEAIEKIIQEKKISSKINYDVLKSLNAPPPLQAQSEEQEDIEQLDTSSNKRRRSSSGDVSAGRNSKKKGKFESIGLPVFGESVDSPVGVSQADAKEPAKIEETKKEESTNALSEEEIDDYDEEEQPATESVSVLQMLRQHTQGDEDENDYDYSYGYEDPDDY